MSNVKDIHSRSSNIIAATGGEGEMFMVDLHEVGAIDYCNRSGFGTFVMRLGGASLQFETPEEHWVKKVMNQWKDLKDSYE